ncbi:hypothetical protein MKW94_007181, partial [Papaver nudicaule]|nr:hypothetical protein [Papaver nudicaule]
MVVDAGDEVIEQVNEEVSGSVPVDASQVEGVTQVEVPSVNARPRPNIECCDPEELYHSDYEDGPEEEVIPNDEGPEDDLQEEINKVLRSTDEFKEFVKNSSRVYEEEELNKWNTDTTILNKCWIGQEWATYLHCKDYIKDQQIFQNHDIKQLKNTRQKQSYECVHKESQGCKWIIYCSPVNNKVTFKCKTGYFEHTCDTTHGIINPLARARWVFRMMLDKFKAHPNYKPKNFQAEIKREHKVEISYMTAWHARHLCIERVMGNFEESYSFLPEFCSQLLKKNPGSVATVKWDDKGKFVHCCIAYKVCIDGWVNGGRPLLGLDGTHLWGKYLGVLLAITALDGNNGLYPIAIFLCRSETKEKWINFLEIMAPHLKRHERAITFISDRQKGLKAGVDVNFSDVNHYHRYCFRHIWKNMKKQHPGQHMESCSWNAAKAYTTPEFERNMERIGEAKESAKKYLEKEECEHWARSFFDFSSKCEHITSNFCEAFNSWILDIRGLPVCKLLKQFHLMMMRLMYDRAEQGEGYVDGDVVPRDKKIYLENREKMNFYTRVPSNKDEWSVADAHGNTWNVHLRNHTCDCNYWQVTGIPCPHVIQAAYHNQGHVFR